LTKPSNFTTYAIAIAIGLVALPVLLERAPGIGLRWKFAAAANAADLGLGDAQKLLEAATAGLKDPEDEADYWNVSLKIALKQSREQVIAILKKAVSKDPVRFARLALIASNHFSSREDYVGAIEATTIYYESLNVSKEAAPPVEPVLLNQIAYYRALGNVQLLEALDDIDQAIELDPERWQYLDTRAWVLYRLGLYQQALEDINKSIRLADAEVNETQNDFFNVLSSWLNGSPEPTSADGVFTQREADPVTWSLGALHYHRARILEALGKHTEAEPDWKWLREHRLPLDDRLN
jgi:tetratricopeptide (TPR) repeat protein